MQASIGALVGYLKVVFSLLVGVDPGVLVAQVSTGYNRLKKYVMRDHVASVTDQR